MIYIGKERLKSSFVAYPEKMPSCEFHDCTNVGTGSVISRTINNNRIAVTELIISSDSSEGRE